MEINSAIFGCILYCLFNKLLISGFIFIILSKKVICIPVCFPFGCKIVGDNCWGSPINVTCLLPFKIGNNVSTSGDWVVSSITTNLKLYFSNLSIIEVEQVVITISVSSIIVLHFFLKSSSSKSTKFCKLIFWTFLSYSINSLVLATTLKILNCFGFEFLFFIAVLIFNKAKAKLSAAALVGAHTKILSFIFLRDNSILYIKNEAVKVLPVPGGPWIKFRTCFLVLFIAIFWDEFNSPYPSILYTS